MNKTWNQSFVKRENKSLVLATIREHTPISRAEIAKITGLNKGTVSSLVSELLDEHLLQESGPGESSGGRRPVMLHFNPSAGCSIGIDLGVNYLLCILTDLEGRIILEKRAFFEEVTFNQTVALLEKTTDELILQAPSTPYGVIGIGVGVPGLVGHAGEIIFAPNLGWKKKSIKERLETRYKMPVIIENEANAGAYGEKMFGIGLPHKNIAYISVGMGIGVGLLLDGKLYKGTNGFSGEFGHMTIDVNGKPCLCGNSGCWELYASEKAILEKVDKKATFESIVEEAKNGNTLIISMIQEVGTYLGIGISNIVNAYNPEQVIIGNRMHSLQRWLEPILEKTVQERALTFHQRKLELSFSTLTTHSSALGVAAFTIEKFLQGIRA